MAGGRISATSRLIGKNCPRCRWPFSIGQRVEVLTGQGVAVVVHAICPRAEPPKLSEATRAERRAAWDAIEDTDELTAEERTAYREGRW